MRGMWIVAALAAAGGVAHAAAPSIAAYGRLPAMQSVQISPGGGLYGYVGAVDDKRFVIVRDASDGKVIQTVDTNDRKVRGLRWADDRHLLIVMTGTQDFSGADKYELAAVMLANVKTHRLSQLAPTEDLPEGSLLATSQQGERAYGFFGAKDMIKRVDLDSGQVITATTLPPRVDSLAVAPDGRVVARVETTNYGQDWSVLAGADSRRVLAAGRSVHGQPEVFAFGRTADTILFSKPEDGDFEAPREIDLVTGKIGEPLVKGAESNPLRDRHSRLLIGFQIDGASDETNVFFDPAVQARWNGVAAAFPHEKVSLESYDDAMSRWIVKTEGDHDSGRYFIVDLKTSKAIALGAEYPDVKPQDVASFKWFAYQASDGTPLSAVLTLPPGLDLANARNLPVVVLPHGGPAARDTPHFEWWSQAIASRGYVVLQPNFRGSTGYGERFERAGWGQWGRRMQTDVSDGLAALVAKGVVDPKRACIVGWSYGGYATLAGITVQNGLYRCAAAGGAVSDLAGMLSYEYDRSGKASSTMRYWKASMALKSVNDPAAAAVSPARLANRADAPLLLIHGKDDTVVPFSQAQEMLGAMRAAHKPVELTVLDGEDHWLSSGRTRTRMLEAMIGFLEKNNPSDIPAR